MTRLRHAIGALLVGALLLQVTILGPAGVCVRAGVAEIGVAAGVGAMVDPHAAHAAHGATRHEAAGHHAAVPSTTEHGLPAAPGDLPDHCPMAMSCVLTGIAAGAHGLPAGTPAASLVIAARDDVLPAFARRAPEPPPPRG